MYIGRCRIICCGYVAIYVLPRIPQVYECVVKVWQAWDIINTLGTCSSKYQRTQSVGPDLVGTAKLPGHSQVGVYCYIKNNMTCMGCQALRMSCGCMVKVLQALDIINLPGPCSSKPQSTQVVGPDLVRTTKPLQAILMNEYDAR